MSDVTEDGLVEVRMLGLPLVLRERSRQQGADLLRELTLLRAGQGHLGHAPARLVALAHELETVYAPYSQAEDEELDAAMDRGEQVMEAVVFRVPPAVTAFLEHVRVILGEVDAYCRADGYLLTLAPAADIAAYRDWSIEEVLRQADGHPPTPWAEYAEAHDLR